MTEGPGVTARTVDVGDGLKLNVEWSGTGPPLLLLHGFTGNTSSWQHLAARLEGKFTVIRVDLPGHGRSSAVPDPARYSLVRLAADLALLLDVLQHPQVSLLGYSLGGRAALRLAIAFPERVSSLVLVSTSAGIRDAGERNARKAADDLLADEIERDGVPAFVNRWERLPLWDSQRTLSHAVRSGLRTQRLGADPAGLANSLRGAGAGVTEPVHHKLNSIPNRTLVIAGELDSRYVIHAKELAAAIPNAELETVAAAGHAVYLEKPEEFARVVSGFLSE